MHSHYIVSETLRNKEILSVAARVKTKSMETKSLDGVDGVF
jgi:hypothetical protein